MYIYYSKPVILRMMETVSKSIGEMPSKNFYFGSYYPHYSSLKFLLYLD